MEEQCLAAVPALGSTSVSLGSDPGTWKPVKSNLKSAKPGREARVHARRGQYREERAMGIVGGIAVAGRVEVVGRQRPGKVPADADGAGLSAVCQRAEAVGALDPPIDERLLGAVERARQRGLRRGIRDEGSDGRAEERAG